MAEGEGFEPPVRFPAQWFSRPPVSTAHASLRGMFLVYLCGGRNEIGVNLVSSQFDTQPCTFTPLRNPPRWPVSATTITANASSKRPYAGNARAVRFARN